MSVKEVLRGVAGLILIGLIISACGIGIAWFGGYLAHLLVDIARDGWESAR